MKKGKAYVEIEETPYDETNFLYEEIVEAKGTYGDSIMYYITKDEESNKYHCIIGKIIDNLQWNEYNEQELKELLRRHRTLIADGIE